MISKKAQLTSVVVILAIIGAIVGVMITRQASHSASESSGTSSSDSGSSVAGSGSGDSTTTSSSSGTRTVSKKKKTKTSSGSTSGSDAITSDPTSAKYTLSAFAIGDWGTTVTQDSCCSRSSTYNDYDVNAEDIVASLMDQQASAASAPPKCVLSHGDNFYWTGIDSEVNGGAGKEC
ncbi:hypothetical protein PF006_g23972 [Phytophthora fragariae]|uniref:Uncharacterized protein n=1 Tax=Phytophthora fragariae TaxID=53985 RepID=A0A6A3RH59_9STRA|nr:hypothetical protein PF006_g23972 [Phytophthora fragariae]